MILSDLVGTGEPLERIIFDKEVSINFIKYLTLGLLPVAANVIVPGILKSLLKGMLEFGEYVKNLKDNNSQFLGLLVLLIFTWLALGMYLSELGFNQMYNNAFLVNFFLVVFLSLLCLMCVYIFHFIFFRQSNWLNFHTVDFILFQIVIGLLIYMGLASEWFAASVYQIWIRPIILSLILLFIVYRVLRLIYFLRNEYTQSAYLIFYYLCAIEIAPYLIIGKILSNLK